MAQYSSTPVQVVTANQNVLLTETPVRSCKPCIIHRQGSGLVTLRGITNQCTAHFKVTFNANIAVPATGGTVGAISVALALEGEPLASTNAIVTPAAVDNYFNVSGTAFIDVPKGCCVDIAIRNTSNPAQAINVQNANITVERIG